MSFKIAAQGTGDYSQLFQRCHTETSRQSRKELKTFSPNSTINPGYSNISAASEATDEAQTGTMSDNQDQNTKLIRLTRSFRTRWDLFTMFLVLYNCFTIPIVVAFQPEETFGFVVMNFIIDCVFLADIVMNFYTTYLDQNGDEILDQKKIAQNYLWGSFWIDCVATVPIDNFLVLFSDNAGVYSQLLQFSDLLRLNRILRLGRIIRFTRTRDDIKAALKLVQLTLYLILWVHTTGCIWFLIIRNDENWIPVPDFYTGTTQLYSASMWTQYFTSFYHAVWLLVGGEVGPRDAIQASTASILIIVGALITAVLFGEMAVLMTNLSRRQTQFQEILDGALTTMSNMQISPDLTNDILDYLTSTQSSSSAQEEYGKFKEFISPSLQQEVSAFIYDPIISKNAVLSNESQLTNLLLHKLQNKFNNPEEEIVTEGDQTFSLYFLVNGECQVWITDKNKQRNRECFLYPGSHFGEISLIYNIPHTATVESSGYCTVAQLQKKDFETLSSQFPSLVTKMRQCTKVYRDPWKQFLLEVLQQATYFHALKEMQFQELVYLMEVVKLEKGSYLFKPGDLSNSIYLVADGLLELSITFNDKHMHMLKRHSKMQNIEQSPRIPKKKNNLEEFFKYNFKLVNCHSIKPKAEIIPVFNDTGVVGAVQLEEEAPNQTEPIGDYPQEIILAEIQQGALLQSKYALFNQSHQTQCKALKNSIIYALRMDVLENLAKENQSFKQEIQFVKNEITMNGGEKGIGTQRNFYDVNEIDMSQSRRAQQRFQSAIVRVLIFLRNQKIKESGQIASLLPRLRAVIHCQEAGNFDLADQVMRGEIPSHYILEDGTLDPAAISQESRNTLNRNHPVIKAFNDIFTSITTNEGEFIQKYSAMEKLVVQQQEQIEKFKQQIELLKQKLSKSSGIIIQPKAVLSYEQDVRSRRVFKIDIDKVHQATKERQLRRKIRKQQMQNPRAISASPARLSDKSPMCKTDLLTLIKRKRQQN